MTAGSVAVPTIIPLRVPIPGKSKLNIDTNTSIEIRTDTQGSEIYYTTNGTKPEPFQKQGERTTLKYRRPFLLGEGKRTVKAVAVSGDGRESNVVSKTFMIERVPPQDRDSDDESFKKKQGIKSTAGYSANTIMKKLLEEDNTLALEDLTISGSSKRQPTQGPRFTASRLGNKTGPKSPKTPKPPKTLEAKTSLDFSASRPRNAPENITQANRIQRETDFLKCIYCLADRPSDPYARFCTECGSPVPPVPNTRLPPPEPGQVGMCVGCNSMVPLNTDKCVVCETPIPPQMIPQASIKLRSKIMCNSCGTANPVNLNYCVTCEAKLPANAKPLFAGDSAPPQPSKEGRLLCCNKCGRVNNSDARFCDWCGAKPAPPSCHLICSRCGGSNQPYAKFCNCCGVQIEPPQRQDPRNSGITQDGFTTSSNLFGNSLMDSWLPVATPVSMIPKKGVATQTTGLFYPSNKDLQKKGEMEETMRQVQEAMSDRKPPLSAVSPGKGYWRQQMEHICSHMKAHAQNHQEFRASIGEPKIGKIISATVHEDGYEMNLNVCFALRGQKDNMTGKPMNISKGGFLSQLTESRRHSFNGSVTSMESDNKIPPKKTIKKKKKKEDSNLSAEDKLLLKEVGAKGEGDAEEVEKLLEQSADSNCVNWDGIPVLTVAVMNMKEECIVPLVNAGAKLDKKAGLKGNTALHEAVNLGPEGQKIIQILLDCGGNPKKIKNDKGETAYDLAVKNKHESIIASFNSNIGQEMLKKMSKID
ncbi:double zinc ribbon and ankyrin repeat-containing protein 1-like [Saccoglossus kowalevskii]|uniref:Double zinc ribbon and ankyrin repeat-containing protein 1 n=1 Tax=Saccoglossus kowalevskii TaxID=10224 RepID=A0ABM0GZK1_SACKO|nr:PREDICTED: double zinc ribbon and ankyrin repeat-containing protein 1-like [Saccoglossus kowalevskii]